MNNKDELVVVETRAKKNEFRIKEIKTEKVIIDGKEVEILKLIGE